MIKILERFQDIDKETDLSFLTDDQTFSYVENCKLKASAKTDLRSKFSKSDPLLVDLLK